MHQALREWSKGEAGLKVGKGAIVYHASGTRARPRVSGYPPFEG